MLLRKKSVGHHLVSDSHPAAAKKHGHGFCNIQLNLRIKAPNSSYKLLLADNNKNIKQE
jgi:hypothetical protein